MPKYTCLKGIDMGGKRYEPGDSITFTEKQAKHMIKKGAVKAPKPKKVKP